MRKNAKHEKEAIMVKTGTNTQILDKWDIMLSLSSGALTGSIDMLFIKDISWEKARGTKSCTFLTASKD